MLRMKAGMSVYDWICLSWDSWSTLIRVHSALCRFLETCSYGRVERGRKGETPRSDNCDNCVATGTGSLERIRLYYSWQVYLPCVGVDLSDIHSSQESVRWEGGFVRENGTTTGSAFHWDWGSLPTSFPWLFRRWGTKPFLLLIFLR